MTDRPTTEPAYRYRATCHRVIDGDTYHLDIQLGFRVSTVVPVRLRGVNAPEMTTPEGKAARAFVVRLLSAEVLVPPPLVVETYKDRQSFARWVADVWVGSRGEDGHLGDLLLAAGHAVRA